MILLPDKIRYCLSTTVDKYVCIGERIRRKCDDDDVHIYAPLTCHRYWQHLISRKTFVVLSNLLLVVRKEKISRNTQTAIGKKL